MLEKTRGSKAGVSKNHAKGSGILSIANVGEKPNIEIDYAQVKKAVLIFRALDNGVRQKIINMLEQDGGKLTVTDIYIKLRCEQSIASQHLAILLKAGLVKKDKIGKFGYYRTNIKTFEKVQKAVSEVIEAVG